MGLLSIERVRRPSLVACGIVALLGATGCGARSGLSSSPDSGSAPQVDASVAGTGGGAAGVSGNAGAGGGAVVSLDGGASDAGGRPPINLGCGKGWPATQMTSIANKPTGYSHYTVMGTGATLDGTIAAKAGPRTFWVRVPVDYDPNHKYRVVYIGQGCGGYNVANTATYQLFNEKLGGTDQAIYVALDIPTDMANMDCYDDRDGPKSQEWEAFELFHSVVDDTYCVDNDDIFVAGYHTGGTLANMWGCYFAGDGQHPWNGQAGGPGAAAPRRFAPRYHIRGQAVTDGIEPDNNPPCNGPIAALWLHDQNDTNPIAGDQAALARVLRMNGCEGSLTAPWHQDVTGQGVCKRYTACPARYPVVFCTTSGLGQSARDYIAIPAFTLLFDEASGVDGGVK